MTPALVPWRGDSLDVPALVAAGLLGAGYVVLVRRVRRRGLDWLLPRSLAWAAGVLSVLAVTVTGLGGGARQLLWVFTVQVLVLLLLAPVLLAYGRPLALLADGLDGQRAGRVLLLTTSRAVRFLTSPFLGPLLVPVVLGVVFFSPLLGAALQREWVGQVLQLALLGVGLLLAVGLVGDGTEQDSSLRLGAAVAVGFAELLLDAVPGIVVRLRSTVLAPAGWVGLHRHGGVSPLADQQRAGALLWFVAEVADLPVLFILVRRWIRADERDAVRMDRELDLAGPSAARPSAAGASAAGPPTDAPPTGDPSAAGRPRPQVPVAESPGRPWWETDPSRLAGHRLAAELARNRRPDEPPPESG